MSLSDAQRSIDEQIAQYEQRILELKTRRNTYAHISRLPQELLLSIFEELTVPIHVKWWHRITHVCRLWHWIAIGAPTLWTLPPTHLENYTLLMLDRSRTAPLMVALDKRTSELTTAAIFDHLRRIQVLQIRQSTEQLTRTQEILLASTEVPALDLLGLEVVDMDSPYDRPSSETFTLSSTSFCRSSTLRRLDLTYVAIDWNIFPLPNLTFLSLRMPSSMTTSLEQILTALTGMSSLESLFLELEFNMVEDTATPGIVCLHCLRTLGLPVFDASQLRRLLSHLYLPLLTSFGADINPEAANIDDYMGALTQISSTVYEGDFPTLDFLSLSACSGEFTLSSRHDRSENHTVTIQLPSARSERNNHYNIIRQFMTGMTSIARNKFECLTHICVEADLRSKNLVQLFGSLPNLIALLIMPDSTVLAMNKALKATINYPGGTTIAFPRLLSLGWCGFRWEEYGRNKLLDLCGSLTHRHNAGPPALE
ncbi:hypothetical protein D9619_010113 [Psilocybe cf. subviscida]|uniref:F-box domain-containing protein n=1 Tax=Psilocybe cf. subviscida TaxID=2480587 RepID=A0A8H5F6G0_9AGAR|nr:hypothetical protein D9619_010113 [Psilocybe cf. subviscida]